MSLKRDVMPRRRRSLQRIRPIETRHYCKCATPRYICFWAVAVPGTVCGECEAGHHVL